MLFSFEILNSANFLLSESAATKWKQETQVCLTGEEKQNNPTHTHTHTELAADRENYAQTRDGLKVEQTHINVPIPSPPPPIWRKIEIKLQHNSWNQN